MTNQHGQNPVLVWNKAIPAAVDICLHDLVGLQVQQRPNDIAVCSWDGDLTYHELDKLSSHLAGRLAHLGVGPEVMVPLCFEKSRWAIVAMLAVLKAGGVCVPLDPAYPPARTENILRQIRADVLLASAHLAERFANLVHSAIPISAATFERPSDHADLFQSTVRPHNAVFVFFTSGSTGQPKGVVIEHAAVSTSVRAQGLAQRIGPSSRMLQFAAYTFDVSIGDIFVPLVHGGCVCVPSEDERRNDLAGAIRAMKVNHACLTSTVAKLLHPSEVQSLRSLTFGGEALSRELLQTWAGKVRLVNIYGPTECSIWCMAREDLTADTSEKNIGSGLSSLAWVVNETDYNQLLPVGEIGELLIEGPLLARGYLNDPKKTELVFIEDPHWISQNNFERPRRLYRTGDLAQYNADGTVSFVGRRDGQIKLRGQRIELGEVEFHVKTILSKSSSPTVNDVATITAEIISPEGGKGPPNIAVFISFRDGRNDQFEIDRPSLSRLQQALSELQSELKKHLPAYMIPTAYIPVTKLPTTVSGKTDRKQLRELGSTLSSEELVDFSFHEQSTQVRSRVPVTDIEKKLQNLWAQILSISSENISAADNFIHRGGDSLSIIKLVAAARGQGTRITAAEIFQNPVLSDMAIIARADESAPSVVPPFTLLKSEGAVQSLVNEAATKLQVDATMIEDIYPCTPLQEGLLALSVKQAGYIAQISLTLNSDIDLDQFRAAWEVAIQAQPVLRTRIIHSKREGLLQVVLQEPVVWKQASNLTSYLEDDLKALMSLDDRLTRYAIVAHNGYTFVWTVHHALYDGWMLPLLLRQVCHAYNGAGLGPIPRFNSFIKYLAETDAAGSYKFWKDRLSDAESPVFPSLPSTNFQPSATSNLTHRMKLTKPSLLDFTLSTILQGAWALLVSQYTNSQDVVFGATLTGRNASVIGIDSMVGPTITTIPVRVKLTEESVKDFLHALQYQATAAIPHEHFGLQRIQAVSSEAKEACSFQNLLVIQPETAEVETSLFQISKASEDLSQFNPYALLIQCEIEDCAVLITANYDERVLRSEQVKRILRQYDHIISQLCIADISQPLTDLDLLCAEDKLELYKWNARPPATENCCVHTLIEEQVRKRPNAPAVCGWDGELSYITLDEMAERLAAKLSQSGVGTGSFVPICFEKSIWIVVAILGVMKSGGAFVLLDPTHPKERLKSIVNDVDASIGLASSQQKDLLSGLVQKVIIINEASILQMPLFNVYGEANADNILYAIYSSGTTGKPKGSVIEHASYATSAISHSRAMLMDSTTRSLQFASYSFDASFLEILTVLIVGGCVCIPSDSERLNDVAAAINNLRVNWALLTPSFASTLKRESVPTLTTLVLGGEASSQVHLEEWAVEPLRLINAYGPSECSVANFFAEMDSLSNPRTIGWAAGARGWVTQVGNPDRLAAIGALGELLIEGAVVGREYLKNPTQTAAAFLTAPKWTQENDKLYKSYQEAKGGPRFYRTGDLVSYNHDGSVRFVGRIDAQVKLRGQRLELGEVEHHLQKALQAALGDTNTWKSASAVGIAAEIITPIDGAPTLAAFVCFHRNSVSGEEFGVDPDSSVTLSALLDGLDARLAASLPSFMVPKVFLPVNYIPFSASGKCDRKLLRQVASKLSKDDLLSFSAKRIIKEPKTKMELELRKLWSDVLQAQPKSIGAEDTFIQRGGDSISAIKLVAAARERGIELSVAQVFKHPSLSDMASVATNTVNLSETEIPPFSLLKKATAADISIEVVKQCKVQFHDIEDAYPCTPLQEGLFALSIKQRGSYVAQLLLKLDDSIDLQKFCQAWDKTVNSCAVIRSRILQTENDGIIQIVINRDLTAWGSASNLEAYLETDKKSTMEIGDPLSRKAIVTDEISGTRYFVLTIHHAIYDGWMLPLLTKRLYETYQSGITSGEVPEFKRFIKYLQDADESSSDDFWKQNLVGYEGSDFPTLPSVGHQPHASRLLTHTTDLTKRLRQDATVSTMIQAAWAVLVGQYTSSNDVVFGTTLTGRDTPVAGIDKIFGPTITTVPVRVKIHVEQTIHDFLRSINDSSMELVTASHLGLQHIQSLSSDCRAAAQFQNLLVIQPEVVRNSHIGFELIDRSSDLSQFNPYPLLLQCTISQNQVVAAINFDEQVIDEKQAQRILHQFSHLLLQIAEAETGRRLKDLTLASPQDMAEIKEWNGPVVTREDSCIHSLIMHQTELHPESQAVFAWDGTLSYEELDLLSGQLASHLIKLGVQPEQVVPLCFEKSLWIVISIVAVLRAGAAFTLLDPSHPLDRLEAIVEDAVATFGLCSFKHSERMNKILKDVTVVDKDLFDKLGRSKSPESDRVTSPRNAAYIIYSSGSTGRPKGSILEHSAYSSSAINHSKALGINSETRSLQFASYSFGASLIEMLTTLVVGGCVCIPSDFDRLNNIVGFINKAQVTWAILTPSFASVIKRESVPTLRTLALGGEALSTVHIQEWAAQLRLIHAYGQSECAVASVFMTMNPDTDPKVLGRVTGARGWLADIEDHNRLAPVGVVGELLIEGPILARQYLNSPEKTAAAFISRPCWMGEDSGEQYRLYKTGDLMQYKSDGTIKYVGRKDAQVKIRGQRVELGEVEHHLRKKLSEVDGVAAEVILPKGSPTPMLAAFVCVLQDLSADGSELKVNYDDLEKFRKLLSGLNEQLLQFLPTFMVPSVYIPVNRLPMTVSGKTDRKRLRSLAAELSTDELATFSADRSIKRQPSSEGEKRMQLLWASILQLNVDEIGIDDHFLRIGGDSISAIRLVAAACSDGFALTAADVFQSPILMDMARLLRKSEGAGLSIIEPFALVKPEGRTSRLRADAATQCGIEDNGIEDIYPCTPLQEGLMALSVKRSGSYIAQIVLKVPLDMEIESFKRAWEEVSARNPILRTRIIHSELDGLMQVVLKEKLTWQTPENLQTYLKEDRTIPMGLGDILTRYAIVKHDFTGFRFILTIHHAVYDGWMLPLLLQQVQQSLAVQFTEQIPGFNRFIRYLSDIDLSTSEDFWHSRLVNLEASAFPSLPSRQYQPNATKYAEQRIHATPSIPGITISTVIQAAWAMLLSYYTGSTDVVFGATLAGRNAPVSGIDRMLGPTITTVPVRAVINKQCSVASYLESFQDWMTEIIPHSHLGLQRIQRVSEDTQAACGFQNLLVIQPASEKSLFDDSFDTANSSEDISLFNPYALLIHCEIGGDDILVTANFDPLVLDTRQVQRMLHQLNHIIAQLSNGAPSMASIDAITAHDLSEIKVWNSQPPSLINMCVPDLFERQVILRPQAHAVDAWDGSLSYEQLDNLSTQLSILLRGPAYGVRENMIIPVCFEKSKWATVALVGIMKAGGAFVLLDPSHPIERLQKITSDCDATVALASHNNVALLSSMVSKIIVVDSSLESPLHNGPGSSVVQNPTSDFRTPLSPQSALYVIYSSGSTGAPKGSVIEHAAYSSTAISHSKAMFMDERTRAIQFASYSFDASILETLTTLIVGGCVCVPSEDERLNDIAGAIDRMRVNWALLTPSFVSLLDPKSVPGLQTLVLGGEAPSMAHVQVWSEQVQLVNAYGPSECSVATFFAKMDISADPKTIGVPAGARGWITVVDNHDQLAPIGAVGELLIEGPALGREYLNNSAQTARAFIENPVWLGNDRNHRLYKTGDLVRYNPDGSVMFVGRKDAQIKLKGQRIELGEIEHHLHKSLDRIASSAASVIIPRGSKTPVLAAFVAAYFAKTMSAEVHYSNPEHFRKLALNVGEQLGRQLPRFMIPSVYIPVTRIPLMPSGKVDRKKLNSIASSMSLDELAAFTKGDVTKRQPSTKMELILQTLWGKVFNIDHDQISTDDSFIRIGGDSITAVRLVAAARKEKLQLTVADIFEFPVLSSLAGVLSGRIESVTVADTSAFKTFSFLDKSETDAISQRLSPSVSPGLVEDIMEATDYQAIYVNSSLLRPTGSHFYFKLDFERALDWRRLEAACQALVARHAILRTVFVRHKNQLLQVVLRHISVHFEVIECNDIPGQSLTSIETDKMRDNGLGLRILHFMWLTDGRKSQLLFRISHAQYDGICLPLLLRDLEAAYLGEALSTPPPYSQYIHYTRMITDNAEAYWSQFLSGSQMTKVISRFDPTRRGFANSLISRVLPLSSAKANSTTFATLMKAAWSFVLAQVSGNVDVVFGQLVSGRTLPFDGIEQVIGACPNLIPIRVRLDSPSIAGLLEQIRRQQIAALPYETLSFTKIIDRCTNWCPQLGFTSIMQHQNLDEVVEDFYFAGEACKFDGVASPQNFTDIGVLSAPHKDGTKIEIAFCSDAISSRFAEDLLAKLCTAVSFFAANPSAELPATPPQEAFKVEHVLSLQV